MYRITSYNVCYTKLLRDSMKLVKFFEAHAEPVSCLKFTPDGKYLISGSHDGHVKIWSTDNYKIKKVFSGHTNAINRITSYNVCYTKLLRVTA